MNSFDQMENPGTLSRVEKLAPEHNVDEFRSGTNSLDHWLRRHAFRNQNVANSPQTLAPLQLFLRIDDVRGERPNRRAVAANVEVRGAQLQTRRVLDVVAVACRNAAGRKRAGHFAAGHRTDLRILHTADARA